MNWIKLNNRDVNTNHITYIDYERRDLIITFNFVNGERIITQYENEKQFDARKDYLNKITRYYGN